MLRLPVRYSQLCGAMTSLGRQLLILSLWIGTLAAVQAKPPHLLLIVADDLGYGDLGCTGSARIATPHIDQLAEQGVLCTQAYVASSVCSPSRAGLLTGRDPRRFGYEGNLNSGASHYPTRPELLGLPVGEHTLADHLKAAGYRTALVGKWHLGDHPDFHPNARGFDHFCGMLNGGHSYFLSAAHHLERNGAPIQEFSSDYITDFFTDEAIRWIDAEQAESPEQPWMMMLSYNAPHTPMEATVEDLAACQHIHDKNRRTYAAMVRGLDRGVGRVVRHLSDRQMLADTLIVFLSDNGGATTNASWNGPLSGAKGTLLEGGIRVPMIWSWPTHLPTGEVCETVVSGLDILATFLAAAEAKPLPLNPPASYHDARNRRREVRRFGDYDSQNLLPLLAGAEQLPSRTLYWRLQGQAAVLDGESKLIRLNHRPAQMFHPTSDPGEQQDLAASEEEELKRLYRLLGKWEANLATVPLWDSSPFWWGHSAELYDTCQPRPEPK